MAMKFFEKFLIQKLEHFSAGGSFGRFSTSCDMNNPYGRSYGLVLMTEKKIWPCPVGRILWIGLSDRNEILALSCGKNPMDWS
jgi:hypothetical protein